MQILQYTNKYANMQIYMQSSQALNVCATLSLRNKFSELQQIVSDSVDILIAAETKIDSSFPTAYFCLAIYHTSYRLDICSKSGGILVYINSNIAARKLNCSEFCNSIQAVPFEINLRKEKWFVISIYWSSSKNGNFFLNALKIS